MGYAGFYKTSHPAAVEPTEPSLTLYEYNDAGAVSKMIEKIGGHERITNYVFDDSARVQREYISYRGVYRTITYTYDEMGLVVSKDSKDSAVPDVQF